MIRFALVAALLASAPVRASPVDDVVTAYEALGRQASADDGPGWPDMRKPPPTGARKPLRRSGLGSTPHPPRPRAARRH